MKKLFGKTFGILEKAIELRTKRNSILAGNIANLDTPGYRSRDIDFEKIMAKYLEPSPEPSKLLLTNPHHMIETGELAEKMAVSPDENGADDMPRPSPSLTVTDKRHFPYGAEDDRHTIIHVSEERGTPNNVDIDHEMAKLAENNLQYQAAVQALIKGFDMIRTAVTEGGKA
jgi:flagellar basal-body rod protein FlgB